ncbi:MAG: DUF4258 domain-containing protein [Hylemonella sp.]
MSQGLGSYNHALTQAIKKLSAANADTARVKFSPHAEDQMELREFDHEQVFTCLRNGKAYGPEIEKGQLRANVIHRGHHIRVVVGGLDDVGEDWTQLQRIRVITVIETN